jgi:dinuclear metal center YbgI/SA1388 family protein
VWTIGDLSRILDERFPAELAEDWDNTGLLVGDRAAPARHAMTCLTITPESAAEAIDRSADLIVTHHPLPFRPLNRITTDSLAGKLLWRLIRAGIAVYSPHTRFDSAAGGINEMLCARLGLRDVGPIVSQSAASPTALGSGRLGTLPHALRWPDWVEWVKNGLGLASVRGVHSGVQSLARVAVACGSGGSLLAAAIERGCDAFVTGEMSFHACLEAEAEGVAVVLLGHFASERQGVVHLAELVRGLAPGLAVWCSERESDPIQAY